ncbi:MAG: hypothetical protein NTX79_07960 [Candidatus Micrarchaeota archaeon]|nr:hypothetical protein [Candidatus Micrarchaeota archaeon]
MANLGGGALQEESPEQKLSLLLGNALEMQVKEKTDSFGGLLTREAAMLLLCQENGITTEKKLLLSGAPSSVLPFSFSARVDRIFPVQQFPGGTMRTVRLHISDKSGEATLVLWNEQAKVAEGNLLPGDSIECTGAYVRAGEIAIGRNGGIARAGKRQAASVAGLADGICNVEGVAGKAGGVHTYRDRRTGVEKTMHSFSICSGGKCVRVAAWSLPEGAHLPKQGEQVVLENATFRNGELHLNAFSRIVAAGGFCTGHQSGKFRGVAIDGSGAVIAVGAEKFRMPLQNALSLLGLRVVPPGVDAATLLSIKSCALEGKEAHYLSEGGNLASLTFEN